MIDTVVIEWKPGALEEITETIPDKVIYEIARTTLDLVIPTIPQNTGKMRRATISGGVRGGNGEYYIGSYTNYAKYVYEMDNNKTHWTTPGTNSYWFKEYWLKHGKGIASMVIEENKIK